MRGLRTAGARRGVTGCATTSGVNGRPRIAAARAVWSLSACGLVSEEACVAIVAVQRCKDAKASFISAPNRPAATLDAPVLTSGALEVPAVSAPIVEVRRFRESRGRRFRESRGRRGLRGVDRCCGGDALDAHGLQKRLCAALGGGEDAWRGCGEGCGSAAPRFRARLCFVRWWNTLGRTGRRFLEPTDDASQEERGQPFQLAGTPSSHVGSSRPT